MTDDRTSVGPPLVALPACRADKSGLAFHTIGDKYVRAVAEAAGCLPVMLPSLGGLLDLDDLVRRLDGLVLTGSPSNVHPTAYGQPADPKAEPHDPDRDAVTLPLIRKAAAAGLPLFAICRGLQELNAALGGTLHARVHEVEGRADHRRPEDPDVAVQYAPRHPVHLTPGGQLAALVGPGPIQVNSLHGQAAADVAPGLQIEATAEDGTVEALSKPDAPGFLLAVQWHPEWRATENPVSAALFRAFGDAARAHAGARQRAAESPAAAQ
jgi:putative glutamine amidotransferase